MKKKLKVKVIGCGGIGLCVLNVLPRYLTYLADYDPDLSLIDGDSYEDNNRVRQAFARKGNKAEVTTEAIRAAFPNLYCWTTAEYITEDNVCMLIRENDVVFSCVDNHATRKLLSDRCQQLHNVVLISGGNDYEDGNVQIHVRKDGVDLTKPIANQYHPEIANPQDKNPGDSVRHSGCDAQQVSAPQILITNNSVAAVMLNAFYDWLQGVFDGKKKYDEVYADCLTNCCRPVVRK